MMTLECVITMDEDGATVPLGSNDLQLQLISSSERQAGSDSATITPAVPSKPCKQTSATGGSTGVGAGSTSSGPGPCGPATTPRASPQAGGAAHDEQHHDSDDSELPVEPHETAVTVSAAASGSSPATMLQVPADTRTLTPTCAVATSGFDITPYNARLLRALALCNSAEITAEGEVVSGNPTDTAIARFVEQVAGSGFSERTRSICTRLGEWPNGQSQCQYQCQYK